MAKVVYKKYNLNSQGDYEIKTKWRSVTADPPSGGVRYRSYTFDRRTGFFTLTQDTDYRLGQPFLYSATGSNPTKEFHSYVQEDSKWILRETYYSENIISRGSYIGEVTAEDGTYPRSGESGGYWYEWDRYANTTPSVYASTTNYGSKKSNFSIGYSVSDNEDTYVRVTITYNGRTLDSKSVRTGQTQYYNVSIDDFSLGSHTIRITATDSSGASDYTNVYFSKTNAAPTITGSTTSIGSVKGDFQITYAVADADGDDVRVQVMVDNTVIQYPISVPLNRTQTVNIRLADYSLGEHKIVVTATDSKNASATRTYYFSKTNQAPTISGSDLDMGGQYKDFSIDYIVQDADGDSVKVEIKLDGAIKQSPTATTLGVRKYYTVPIKTVDLGRHTIEIIATDSQGASSTRIYTFQKVNSAPVISGQDENLGAKNTGFSYTYTVTDNEEDSVKVIEKVNGNIIRTLNNVTLGASQTITITDEQIKNFELNGLNTIEIEASDGATTTYRRITFVRNNMPPIISDKDKDLGTVTNSLTYNWSATDPEKDPMTATIYLDDKILKARYKLAEGASQNIKIDGIEMLKIPKGNHEIRIVVEDDKGFKSTRKVTFTRKIERLVMKLNGNGIETDELAKRVLISTVGIYVAKGAVIKYEVCNNSFDAKPTWEDATTMVAAGKAFNFQNKAKTAAKAGIDIKVTIEKGTATMQSYISAIGGSFD